MPEELTSQNDGQEIVVGKTIDTLSKSFVIGVAFLYVSGFLIMSIYDFHYGFSEMNPLRPRILAAGGWFALFMAVPFALVRRLRQHQSLKSNMKWWDKAGALVVAYYLSWAVIYLPVSDVFWFDEGNVKPVPAPPAWQVIAGIIVVVVAMIALVMFHTRIPQIVKTIATIAGYSYMVVQAYDSLFVKHQFQQNAILLWMMGVGLLCLHELSRRLWRITPGDWPQTLAGLLVILTFFAKFYYPHIKASWGGGTPIPITLTMSRESVVLPGGKVGCLLIDETDSGFYVVGPTDKHASYVPRTSVALMHFAGASESSIFEPKLK